MSYRIWYPQLDIYDCIRRISLLLSLRTTKSTSIERALIADFFLANPPLLHGVHLPRKPRDVKKLFLDLKIPRPEKGFLSFPAPPILFHKMEPIQNKALWEMAGKGLLEGNNYGNRCLVLSNVGLQLISDSFSYSNKEKEIATFLSQELTDLETDALEDLRQRTGLRRLAS